MKEMEYHFRRALPQDVDSIIEVIQERIDWMDQMGLYQWNKTHYMQRYPRQYFLQRVEDGEFFLALDSSGAVTGVMALLTEDPRWEGTEQKKCYYVHHLAARTGAKGAGRALLCFCEELSRKEGREVVRLDCQLGNDKLNAFYEKLGYQYAGPMVEGEYEGIKREKKLNG